MRTPIPLSLAVLLLAACGGADADEDAGAETDAVETAEAEPREDEGTDAPGEEAVVTVAPPSLSVTREPLELSPMAAASLAVAPAWVRDDLAINYAKMDVMYQEDLGMMLLGLEDTRLVDEVAFTIARTSPEVIAHRDFYPQLFVLNAQLVYAHDAALGYVRLVDTGTAGVDDDFFTTAEYLVETAPGATEARAIDPAIYYWFVVHPRLEDELPLFVNGWTSGRATTPDYGWFWREFLWDAAAEQCPSGRVCPLLSEYLEGVEVFRRLPEGSAFGKEARDTVWAFSDAVLRWGAGAERPIQPNRIYVVACGNCGEYADFRAASLRTALIPARNTGASSNDHTWPEWWWQGEGWQGEGGFYLGGIRRDGVDNDCDGAADDSLLADDKDGDGWTVAGGDCDDARAGAHPGATEVQNGRDDDCDGQADTGFTDAELDGDGDGYSIAAGDCDESRAGAHPGAVEIPNGRDDDCDGAADEGADAADGDGDGYSIAAGDCDDTDAAIHPGATEAANGRDDDCDGRADDGTATTDADGDTVTVAAGDCNDHDAQTRPGAVEKADGKDNDCDGVADDGAGAADADADGFTIEGGDCNDNDAAARPGAAERPNARDDDCDGVADEGITAYDRDGDGFTMAGGDCNDLDAGVNPDAKDPFFSTNRLYAITVSRGDSMEIVDRTEAYATLPATLEFDVKDLAGRPVDGAMITIYGTWAVYGHPESWAVASEIATDIDGRAEITVGEHNPYGYSVTSAAGDNPEPGRLKVAADEILPYETVSVTVTVPGRVPAAPQATQADLGGGAAPEAAVELRFAVEGYRIAGDGHLEGSFSWEREGGRLDAYLLDGWNYDLFQAGEPFEAMAMAQDVAEATIAQGLPRTKKWVLVLANPVRLACTIVGSVRAAAAPAAGFAWSGEQPVVERRFQIPPGGHLALTLGQ